MAFTVERYIQETRVIKSEPDQKQSKAFQILYYGTFPEMEHTELPSLKICNTYNMDSKIVNIDGLWYMIFDCNLYEYIQLFIYSFFSDECIENFDALYYAVKRDYLISLRRKEEAEFFERELRTHPFTMPQYSDRYEKILYNIKYVSFPLLCLHEMVHYSFINELKKEFLKKSIQAAIELTKESLEEKNPVSMLLYDCNIVQEIYCDCEALYGILLLFSKFKNTINPKDIVDSAVLNIMGILMIFESKDLADSNTVMGNYLRLNVLVNYVHVLIIHQYLEEEILAEVNDIVKYYFTDIFPRLRELKIKYRK